MSVLKFRPQLESMDERIVPDAGPTAVPVPAPVADPAPPAPAPNPQRGDMTDAQLNAAIAAAELRVARLEGQLTAYLEMALALSKSYNDAITVAAALDKVTQAEEAKLAKIGADPNLGTNSEAYRRQASAVQAARDQVIRALSVAEGFEIALKGVQVSAKAVEIQLGLAICELEALRWERDHHTPRPA